MPSDYDLIVLGGSIEGRVAAITAVNYGARVALVEPPTLFDQRQQQRYLLKALQQLGESNQRQEVVSLFRQEAVGAKTWNWQAVLDWSVIASQNQKPELSVAAMSAGGIDVVLEPPERLSRRLVVTTATRKMKARGVIAAFDSVPLPIFEDEAGDGLSPSPTGIDPLLTASELPESIVVWGDSVEAVMWAQALQAVGIQVCLSSDSFLPYEDWDVRRLVRSQLIASGTRILSTSEILQETTDISALSAKSLLFGRGRSALVLPDFVYHPASTYPASTYPDADEQRFERTYLLTNKQLQTLHPRIFACGSLLSGLPMHESIAKAEAQTAVCNALFLPTRQMQYRAIPESHYQFGRVGLTPRFAREGKAPSKSSGGERDAASWDVQAASDPNSAELARTMPNPAYCKLICYEGRLQSIHLLGAGAGELIELLAGSIGQPAASLTQRLPITGSLVALVKKAVVRSQSSKWQPGQWRRDWAENWFNWRRSQDR